MINQKGAAEAVKRIQSNNTFTCPISISANIDDVSYKADWDIQNEGTYDLIFPYLHKDYPTREEVMSFIDSAMRYFNLHTNPGNGNSPPPVTYPGMILPEQQPAEKTVFVGLDMIKVRSDSTIRSYGV